MSATVGVYEDAVAPTIGTHVPISPTGLQRRHEYVYAIGVDPLGDLASRYGVAYTPTTFFVDRRGRIVKRVLGPVSNSELDSQIELALST